MHTNATDEQIPAPIKIWLACDRTISVEMENMLIMQVFLSFVYGRQFVWPSTNKDLCCRCLLEMVVGLVRARSVWRNSFVRVRMTQLPSGNAWSRFFPGKYLKSSPFLFQVVAGLDRRPLVSRTTKWTPFMNKKRGLYWLEGKWITLLVIL